MSVRRRGFARFVEGRTIDRNDRVDISFECRCVVDTTVEIPIDVPVETPEGVWNASLHPANCEERGEGYWLSARWTAGIGYTSDGECETFCASPEDAAKTLRAGSWYGYGNAPD